MVVKGNISILNYTLFMQVILIVIRRRKKKGNPVIQKKDIKVGPISFFTVTLWHIRANHATRDEKIT